MADTRVEAGCRKSMLLLRPVEHSPRIGKDDEAQKYQHATQEMERAEMRISSPADKVFKEMSRIMGEQINTRKFLREPPGEKVDG